MGNCHTVGPNEALVVSGNMNALWMVCFQRLARRKGFLGMNLENKINEKLSIDVLANQTVAQMVISHLFKS